MTKLPPSSGPALSEQYPRVQRFYRRIVDSSNHGVRYQDDLWSFFQQCWHLKDWIKNDRRIPRSIREVVENEIRKRRYIKICGDLANRSKHLRLTRKRAGKEVPRRGAKMMRHISVNLSDTLGRPELSTSSVTYFYRIIRVSGSRIDAIELATRALSQWEALLREWKLIE